MEYRVLAGALGNFYAEGLDPKDSACISPFNTIYSAQTPLMQYTGLKDKNGKEIYEGDVVQTWHRELYSDTHKWSKWEKFGDGIGSVYFDDYDFRWRVACKDNFSPVFMPSDSSRTFSVIGNIYENPELVEG